MGVIGNPFIKNDAPHRVIMSYRLPEISGYGQSCDNQGFRLVIGIFTDHRQDLLTPYRLCFNLFFSIHAALIPASIYLLLTTETLEEGMKYVPS